MKIRIAVILCLFTAVSLAQVSGKPEVIFVKGGTFKMGSNEETESPIHTVSVDNFSIGKYEITVGQYRQFCNETGAEMPKEPKRGWEENEPITKVDWTDAVAYCNWLEEKYGGNWRLPTEAEWEYAARGGSKNSNYTYSGGNDMNRVGWYKENADMQAHPVGRKEPNELGIYDMSGNAREWCQDYYSEGYYAVSEPKNPQGPDKGTFRTMRGGSWYTPSDRTTVSSRSIRLMPGRTDYSMGFRVVLTE